MKLADAVLSAVSFVVLLSPSSAFAQAAPALAPIAQFLVQARQGAAPAIEAAVPVDPVPGAACGDQCFIGNMTEMQYIQLVQRLRTEPERYSAIMAVPDAGFARVTGNGLEWFLHLTDPGRAAAILAKVPQSTWERFDFNAYRRILGRLGDEQWLAVWGTKIPANVWRTMTLRQYTDAVSVPSRLRRAIDATPPAFWSRLAYQDVSVIMAYLPDESAAVLAAWTRSQTR